MYAKKLLFWNVDTQVDFMDKEGKLYVSDAEKILPLLKVLTTYAKANHIQVVNTADHHFPDAQELSDNPDFITTFPPHCMTNSAGAEYVSETQPEEPAIIHWNRFYSDREIQNIALVRNIVVLKDVFDVFKGNQNTQSLVDMLAPQKVFVYGVTTNVCVDCAVCGLAKQNLQVFVIEDAIKELPNIPLPFEKWDALGVKRIQFSEIDNYL